MTPMRNGVQVGDEFKCKRRGHVLKVINVNIELHLAAFKNASGAFRWISIDRLLKPYRFERLVVHAAEQPQAEGLPEHANAA